MVDETQANVWPPGGEQPDFLLPWMLVRTNSIDSDGSFSAGAILELEANDQSGKRVRFTPLFSTYDLAAQFIGGLVGQIVGLDPFRAADLDQFEAILQLMVRASVTHLCLDPNPPQIQTTPLYEMLGTIHSRRGPKS